MHYTGWLEDGTKFDSSLDLGRPFEFNLGAGEVIKGWDEGIMLLNVGTKAKLIIPPELGYGRQGAGGGGGVAAAAPEAGRGAPAARPRGGGNPRTVAR